MKSKECRILVAGSTGYLGHHLVSQLLNRGADFKALARNKTKLAKMGLNSQQVELAQVTDAQSLYGCCNDVDIVISCLGITRQKDGMGYMDVDFRANLNLLQEAERAEVKKFIYISALNAKMFPEVRMLKAKERFAARLLRSQKLEPCVIRPNGFYSDIEAFYSMAKAGRIYLFGHGEVRVNPIHGEDLAQFCLEAIDKTDRELDVGGPEIFTVNEIAQLAFNAQNKKARITYLPDWLRKVSMNISSRLPEKFGGSVEFFLTVVAQDMIAPTYGKQKLCKHFENIIKMENV